MLVVVKRGEEELREWLATEAGFIEGFCTFEEEPIFLEPFQRAFLRNKSRYRCVAKARQIGFSWLFAGEAIARSHFEDGHTSIFVSYNLDDSKEKIRYCDQFYESLPLAYKKRRITDSKFELAFESNKGTPGTKNRVSRIISHPSRAPRGKKGDIYLDELAHYLNDRTVYSGSTALILRAEGAQLTVCSTPLGQRGIFWEIDKQRGGQKYGAYARQRVPWWLSRFFCKDVKRAALEAPQMPTPERVHKFGKQGIIDQFNALELGIFQQEFELSYLDDTDAFYPYELILACTDPDLMVYNEFSDIPRLKGRLIGGFDVGRTKDSSELVLFEEIGERKILRLIKEYNQVPFREQEGDLKRLLEILPVARLSIDNTGIGMQLAENLSQDFPQVERVTFTLASKERLANDFKIQLQSRILVLPMDRKLIGQIHGVRRVVSRANRIKFVAPRDATGHADRYWAATLAAQRELITADEAISVTIVRV